MKVWGRMRFDDLLHLHPSHLSLRGAVLRRTKTSGVGKRVKCLPTHISPHCSFLDPGWTKVRLALWPHLHPYVPDYFLPRPYR